MTGNVFIDLAISLIGIVIMVALSRAIFGTVAPAINQEKAAERLAFDEPDFEPVAWLVDESSGGALARNNAGEIALVLVHGDRLATRRFGPGAARIAYENGYLSIPSQDHTFRKIHLRADESAAAQWLKQGRK